MRIKKSFIIILSGCISILFSCKSEKNDVLSYINPFLGTSTGYANLIPVASAPYGMVQLGADTRLGGPGYKIEDSEKDLKQKLTEEKDVELIVSYLAEVKKDVISNC